VKSQGGQFPLPLALPAKRKIHFVLLISENKKERFLLNALALEIIQILVDPWILNQLNLEQLQVVDAMDI
jgi:hypothetical protein